MRGSPFSLEGDLREIDWNVQSYIDVVGEEILGNMSQELDDLFIIKAGLPQAYDVNIGILRALLGDLRGEAGAAAALGSFD